ncbi:MAG: oligosaccharide flippase family protein [Candidatus Dormibacteria bacterium]
MADLVGVQESGAPPLARPRVRGSAHTDAAILVGSRAVMFAASTAALVAVARILGPAEYGVLAVAGAISLAVQAFGALGLDQLYLRGDVDEAELRAASLTMGLLQAAVVVVAAACWPQLSVVARLCTVALGVSQATATMRMPWLLVPQRQLRFKVRARREVAAFVLIQLVIVAAVVSGFGPLVASVLAMAAGVFLIAMSRAQVGARTTVSPRRLWRLLVGGVPFVLSSIFYTLYLQVDAALLAALAAPAIVAQYSVAYSFVAAAAVLPVALNNDVLRPHLYRAVTAQARASLARRFAALSVVLGLIAGASVFFLGPIATQLLYGHRYAPAGALVMILAVALPFHYVNSWAGNMLVATMRMRELVAVQGILTVGNITANLLVIPGLGARGVAIVTVGTEAAGVALYACLLLRRRRYGVAMATSRLPQR